MATRRIRYAVLVTGDRNWSDGEAIGQRMGAMPEGTLFIHGNATGADYWCDEMASQLGYPRARVPYCAWMGAAGGPFRNAVMLQMLLGLGALGTKIEVWAFHDDLYGLTANGHKRGTKDMVDQAKKEGLKVRHYKHGKN